MNRSLPLRVGVTGGIGSGKSVVCRMFSMLGVPVYDSDSRAKALMAAGGPLENALRGRFGDRCYAADRLDRAYLASRVFGKPEELAALNAIVHPAVTDDFDMWVGSCAADYVMVESAILLECELKEHVDAVVAVSAPEPLRARRAAARDGASVDSVMERIRSQMGDAAREKEADFIIRNDDMHPVWEQVLALDEELRRVAAGRRYNR